MATTEERSFRLNEARAIQILIYQQAGTLGKAFLEYVMNSIDAGAGRIDIDFDTDQYTITDDGRGIQTREEIEKFFEELAFDHAEDGYDRTYGKFGIGRAQLWAFGTSTWRTGPFEMHVSMEKGKKPVYTLTSELEPVDGVRISGRFFRPMTMMDRQMARNEIARLAKYAQIEVYINGELVNNPPDREKWDEETDEAYFSWSERGDVEVYNLGVLIRNYPASKLGSGGVIVSKVPLLVNMARNDVLEADDENWVRIKEVVRKHARTKVKKNRKSLTDEDRENLAMQVLSGEVSWEEAREMRLITDGKGRQHGLETIFRGSRDRIPLTWTGNRVGDRSVDAVGKARVAEKAHDRKLAFTIHPKTMERFQAEGINDLRRKLRDVFGSEENNRFWRSDEKDWAPTVPFEQILDLINDSHEVVPPKDYTKAEKELLKTLEQYNHKITYSVASQRGERLPYAHQRTIGLGESETANAWTDGHSNIWIRRDHVNNMPRGFAQTAYIVALLLHEYTHQDNDLGDNDHDYAFYETFHNAMLHSDHFLGSPFHIAENLFESVIKKAERGKDLYLYKNAARQASVMEQGRSNINRAAEEEGVPLPDPEQKAEDAAPAPEKKAPGGKPKASGSGGSKKTTTRKRKAGKDTRRAPQRMAADETPVQGSLLPDTDEDDGPRM